MHFYPFLAFNIENHSSLAMIRYRKACNTLKSIYQQGAFKKKQQSEKMLQQACKLKDRALFLLHKSDQVINDKNPFNFLKNLKILRLISFDLKDISEKLCDLRDQARKIFKRMNKD